MIFVSHNGNVSPQSSSFLSTVDPLPASSDVLKLIIAYIISISVHSGGGSSSSIGTSNYEFCITL
jgi:hypothetical protein